VYVMGVKSRAAIAMSLFIVGSVSLLGAIPYARRGHLSWRIVAGFTPAAMLGAYLGSQLIKLPLITDTVQLVSFGLVMLAASVLMIGKGKGSAQRHQASSEERSSLRSLQWLAIPAEGLGVGIVTGFVGVGGGFLIIPALVLLSQLPMKTAVGTSLLIIAFNSATGFMGYLEQVAIDWPLTFSFTLAAGIGTVLGSLLARKIEASKLQKGFGYFVLAVAIFVLIRR
ncbi:MAG: sulfite exporter TauE/SafE family protein, partial [Phormidesmis sp.]